MSDARSDVAAWTAQGLIPVSRVREALQVAQAMPTHAVWLRFLDRLLLGSGAVALSAALGFFIAANWTSLGRFGKLALVEVVVVAAVALVAWRGIDSKWGRALLVVAALAVGTLLALVGQTYQTGADPWELFAAWAVAIAPWVVVGRQPPLWLLWIGIVDAAVWLYLGATVGSDSEEAILWTLLAIHVVALIAWEAAAARGAPWLQSRWVPRVLAVSAVALASVLFLGNLFNDESLVAAAFAYVAVLAAGYVLYRRRAVDVFVLAAGVLSLVVVVPVTIAKLLDIDGPAAWLMVAAITIALSAAGAYWLRGVTRARSA